MIPALGQWRQEDQNFMVTHVWPVLKINTRASEMAQWVTVLAAKANDLNPYVEGESQSPQTVL